MSLYPPRLWESPMSPDPLRAAIDRFTASPRMSAVPELGDATERLRRVPSASAGTPPPRDAERPPRR